MCGFIVWFSPSGHKGSQEVFEKATRLMSHRGPDGEGFHFEGPIALGHRRLSIIDLSAGSQPMYNEDRSIVVVFNGEIYNFQETKKLLEDKGHIFATHSDSEVIIHAYEEWGVACVEHFNGMFAFALWDSRVKKLWVVRDRLGIKPLYWWSDGKQFACASEIKPLLAVSSLKPEINEKVLDAYFTLGYVPAPETLFKGIRKLEPGMFLTFDGSELQETRYWDFAKITPGDWSEEEAKSKVISILSDSVKKCLLSDVPLGVFLSGGLDSSAVVALMRDNGVNEINSFTVGYNGAGESEEHFAETVAKHCQSRHFVHHLASEEFLSSLDTLVKFTEEPLVEPAAIALYHLSLLARKEATVLLSGEGSDEVFGGYGLYRRMLAMDRWHRRIPSFLRKPIVATGRRSSNLRTRKYADWFGQSLETRYRGTSASLTDSVQQKFYTPAFYEGKGSYMDNTFTRHFSEVAGNRDPLARMQYVDTKTWLVDDLLLKADKMTMAASVELRVPFLDHRVVELGAAFPGNLKIKNDEGKWILKQAMSQKLPREIIWRRKMGFPVPTRRWFGAELLPKIKDFLNDKNELPWINAQSTSDILQTRHQSDEDHSRWIMTLLVFVAWRRHFGI